MKCSNAAPWITKSTVTSIGYGFGFTTSTAALIGWPASVSGGNKTIELLKIPANAISFGQWGQLASAISYAFDAAETLKNELKTKQNRLKTTLDISYAVTVSTAFGPATPYTHDVKLEVPKKAVELYGAYEKQVKEVARIRLADFGDVIEPQKKSWVHQALKSANDIVLMYELQVQAESIYLEALAASGLSGNG